MSPRLPRYDSQRQLTTQQPGALTTPSSAGEGLERGARALSGVAKMSAGWLKSLNTIQTTTAEANMKSNTLDILNRADQELDYNKYEDYAKEIQKAKTESLKGIQSIRAREQAALKLNYEAQQATIQLQGMFKKKTVEAGQVAAFKLLDVEKEIYYLSPKNSEKNINNIIDEQVRVGVFGQEEAYKLKKKTLDDARWNHFLNDFMLNPDKTEKDLKAGAYNLSTKAQSQAITHLAELRRQIRDDQNANAHEAALKFLSGTLTFDEIEALEKAPDVRDQISKDEGESLRKAIIQKVKTDARTLIKNEPKSAQYFKLLDQFVDDGIDRTKFRRGVIEAYRDGIITSEEGKFLAELKNNLEDLAWNRRSGIIKGAIENIKSWLGMQPNLTDGEIAIKLQQLLQGLSNNENPDDLNAQIKKETIKEQNDWISGVPETGMVLIDKNGKKIRVFPDGHIEDEK